jgi:predicted Zn finger-like uncharacterized protein
MIVICDKCNTKYKLDDATITEEGIKVRCSKCGNTFIVKKPKPEDIQKIGQLQQNPHVTQQELSINSNLDKVINETISDITANQPKPADTGSEFDWSALNENKEGKPQTEEPPPPAFEWKQDQLEIAVKNREQQTETLETSKELTHAENQQGNTIFTYNEPKISGPTVENVLKESIKQARSGYASGTVTAFIKKAVILLVVLAALGGAGYSAYIYKTRLSVIGDNIYTTVLKYIAPNKQVNIGVSVSESRGYFFKNIRGQQLFVIDGNVTNITEHPVSFIKLGANILDNNNNVISSKTFFAGNILTDEELRTYTSDQINSILNNEMGQSLKNFNIPPKASIPFMAVFFDVPDNLSSFTVIPKSTHLGVQ